MLKSLPPIVLIFFASLSTSQEAVSIDSCEKKLHWKLNTTMFHSTTLHTHNYGSDKRKVLTIKNEHYYIICPTKKADVYRYKANSKVYPGLSISCGKNKINVHGDANLNLVYMKPATNDGMGGVTPMTESTIRFEGKRTEKNQVAKNPIPVVTPEYVQCVQDEYHRATLKALRQISKDE